MARAVRESRLWWDQKDCAVWRGAREDFRAVRLAAERGWRRERVRSVRSVERRERYCGRVVWWPRGKQPRPV